MFHDRRRLSSYAVAVLTLLFEPFLDPLPHKPSYKGREDVLRRRGGRGHTPPLRPMGAVTPASRDSIILLGNVRFMDYILTLVGWGHVSKVSFATSGISR